jgi:DNA-binding CsgD family transcriptional regulator
LARATWRSGAISEAELLFAQAVSLLEEEPHGAVLAGAYALWGAFKISWYHADEALALTSKAIAIAERVGATEQLSFALGVEGETEMFCFEHLDGLEKQAQGLRLARLAGDDRRIANALYTTGGNLTEVRRLEEAIPYLEDAIAFGEERDLDFYVGQAQAYLARARFGQGRWEEAGLLVDEALGRRHASSDIAVTALTVRARILARRGLTGSEAILENLWEGAASVALYSLWPLAAARAEVVWLGGSGREIPDLVGPTFARVEGRAPWAAGELAFWLWRAGALGDPPDGLPDPFALQIAGDWRGAAEAWERIGCPYEQADALADGDEPAMRDALAIFTRMGAQPAADRVRARMRETGIKHVPQRPRATTRAAPAGLTRRQLEVLGLLGHGRTNADIARELFITEKTAEHHVSAILRKLGVNTRTEAAAAAAKIGVGVPRT